MHSQPDSDEELPKAKSKLAAIAISGLGALLAALVAWLAAKLGGKQ